jgi:tetratricopeptide (TPR) repeat protein
VDPLLLGSRAAGPQAVRSGTRGVAKDDRGQPLALRLSPWIGQGLLPARDWAGAVAACREAIRLDPELVEARSLLVQCYLQSHEPERADAELQALLRFYPASREAWQQWYDQQNRAGPAGASSPSSDKP